MSDKNMSIANEIIRQMGGTGRLNAMTGAKHFIAIENGIQFKIGRNAKSVNTVRIVLNGMDLYDVEYGRTHGMNYKIKASSEGIYNDMLKADFERETGMYLSF